MIPRPFRPNTPGARFNKHGQDGALTHSCETNGNTISGKRYGNMTGKNVTSIANFNVHYWSVSKNKQT